MIERTEIESGDMTVTKWNGGMTAQIAIFPENAVYGERSFIWRISAATVDIESSDFTLLPDYDRIIASVSGVMELRHENGESVRIEPFKTVHAFDGGMNTRCIGKAGDLNLMLRKNQAKGSIVLLKENEAKTLCLKEGETVLVYYVDENRAEKFIGTGEILLPAGGRRALFRVIIRNL